MYAEIPIKERKVKKKTPYREEKKARRPPMFQTPHWPNAGTNCAETSRGWTSSA